MGLGSSPRWGTKIIIKFKRKIMSSILEEYKKQLNDESLTEEEIMQRFKEDEKKFNKEVNDRVGEYESLDMDKFIDRIGGQERIDAMKKVNEKLDRSELINGKLVEKKQTGGEDLDEWKKGIMEGYDEEYRRLMNR